MGDDAADGAGPEDLAAEVERLRAERDAARAELDQVANQPPSRHRVRRVVAVALVVVSCLSFLTGGIGIWASRNFLDTDVYVSRVAPLADDPAVQSAISRQITAQVMQLVNPKALFEEVLPERGQLLAVPLSSAVQGFVADRVDSFVRTDAFEKLWVELNRQAHAAAVKVLRGDSQVVTAGDRTVTLNLIPVINKVLARITSVSPEIFGKTVNIPDVQITEVPTSAIKKINERFGTDLPPDFGQITVYDAGTLKELQDAVKLFDTIVWGSVVVFVLATLGAFVASVDRRRTFLQLAIADVLLLVLMRRGAFRAQEQVLDLVRVPANKPAVKAVITAIFTGLYDGTRLLLWVLGIGIVIALLAGPGRRTVAFRHRVAAGATALASAARDRGGDPATAAWLVAHRDALQVGGVVVGVLLLWWLNLSWVGVLVLLALVALYVVLLGRLPDASQLAMADAAAPPDPAGTTGHDLTADQGDNTHAAR